MSNCYKAIDKNEDKENEPNSNISSDNQIKKDSNKSFKNI